MAGHIAFIGLGQLGAPIATNLARTGADVVGFDAVGPNDETRMNLEDAGLRIAASAAEAAIGAATVLTVLPTSEIVRTVVTDAALLVAVSPAALFIDLSSGFPPETVRIGDDLRAAGHEFVDAPICKGGVGGARTGDLTLILGGTAEAKAKARAVLGAAATTILDGGELGSGHAVKLVSNLIANAVSPLLAEAVALGVAAGIARDALPELLEHCAPSTMITLRTMIPAADADLHERATFRADLAAKDLRYAKALAESHDVPSFFADAALAEYEIASRTGLGHLEAKRVTWLTAFSGLPTAASR